MLVKIKNNQSGETIIEVLIALMILGLVIGSSISLANKSLRGQQTAQERTEASNVAQSVIEVINMYARKDTAGTTAVFDTSGTKCVSTVFDPDVINGNAFVTYDSSSPDSKCYSGLDNRYFTTVDITIPDPALPNTYEYVVNTVWEGLDTIQNNVVMRYRFSRINP